jgi:hypothetical protein
MIHLLQDWTTMFPVLTSNPTFKFSANKKNGVSFLKAQSSLFYRETLHAFACEKMAEKHMKA